MFIESGVSWLPSFHLARDQDLARRPGRGAVGQPFARRNHPRPHPRHHAAVRCTGPGTVERIVEQIDCDEMLLFSSDYPHWQFEGDAITPPGLSASLLQRMRVDNPLATYPRLKETVS